MGAGDSDRRDGQWRKAVVSGSHHKPHQAGDRCLLKAIARRLVAIGATVVEAAQVKRTCDLVAYNLSDQKHHLVTINPICGEAITS